MTPHLIDDSNYQGMVRELAAWQLKPGMVYDALNMIFDKPGIARHRGPSTALSVLGAVTAFCTSLGISFWQDPLGVVIEELYGANGKDGTIENINKTSGAHSNIGTYFTAAQTIGRAIRHQGTCLFPSSEASATARRLVSVNGSTVNTNLTAANASAWVANNPTVTLGAADNTAASFVGRSVTAFNATNRYYGRCVQVTGAKTFQVFPVPKFTDAALPGGQLSINAQFPTISAGCGKCGASFQNRLLMANCVEITTLLQVQRRIYYSPLPDEPFLQGGTGTVNMWGAVWMSPPDWPTLNYFEVPGADPIVALEPVNDNALLILTSGAPWLLTGQLATQTTLFAPGVTFDLSPINLTADCLSEMSVQRTPHGIIWAGTEGIWNYGGGGRQPFTLGGRLPVDITEGVMHTYWRNLTRGSSFAVHGSFQTRNHYVLSGSSGGSTFCLAYNFDTHAWTTLSGAGTDTFHGVPRPTDPSQCFVARWWDQSGAAPNHTNGQVVRADSLFQPYTAGSTKTDCDGAAIPLSLTTRAMTDEMQSQKIIRRVGVRYRLSQASAGLAVAGGTRIDPADTEGTPTVALGNLSNNALRTILAATQANPIACTTSANHGFQTDDEVDIRGGTGLTAINGRFRITVTGPTTFTLNQSLGSGGGAYNASTATVKKITEQEFDASALDLGQALYLTLSGSPDDFELHGVRVNALEIGFGMAR